MDKIKVDMQYKSLMLKSVSDNKNSMHETKMRINCEDKSNKVCNKEEEGEIFTAESKLEILRDEDKIDRWMYGHKSG